LQNRTLFRGIHLLPPASCWEIKPDSDIKRRTYFESRQWEEQETLPAEAFYPELKNELASIIPSYLRADAPVGMSLTGGLDSRIVMSWGGAEPGQLLCYSFCGPYRECADVVLGRRIAEICNQPHTTITVGPEFFADFSDLAARSVYASDGLMDVSGAIEVYVNRKARQIAPIRVTGNYGSELLRANVAFRPSRWNSELFESEIARRLADVPETYQMERAGSDLSFIAFKQVPWHHFARMSVERSEIDVRSPFLDNRLVSLLYRAPPAFRLSPAGSMHLVRDGNPSLATIPTDRGLLFRGGLVVGGLGALWQDFTVKAEYSVDYGMPPWLARSDSLVRLLRLEKAFLGRHKFYHYRPWYRHELSSYMRDVLLSAPALNRGIFRKEALVRIVTEHATGVGNHTLAIHRALTIELIFNELLSK
jgi:asparagine synthase (glutamine-hydrolysing)